MSHAENSGDIPPQVQARIAELAQQLRIPMTVRKIWQEILSTADRSHAETNDSIGPDIIDIWANLREISPFRAVMDLSVEANLITEREYRRLLAELGEEPATHSVQNAPVWTGIAVNFSSMIKLCGESAA